jgi:uncharacterized protein
MSRVPPVITAWRQHAFEPVPAAERYEALDLVRGFALFGILVVNMALFSWPAYSVLTGGRAWPTRLDVVADWLARFLAEGKFYPLFSFLFGIGITIQMERAQAHGRNFLGVYSRRLLALLAIGLAHAFLVWEGDVLMVYALFGFLMLAFRNRKPRTLLVWAGIFLAIPVAIYAVLSALMAIGSLVPSIDAEIQKALAEESDFYARLTDENLRVFARGSFAEICAARARNVGLAWQYLWSFAPTFLAMFLIGVYAGRRRIFQDIEGNLALIRRVALWALVIGLPANALYTIGYELGSPLEFDLVWVAAIAGVSVGGPALSLCYGAGLLLLLRRDDWRRRLRPLAATGRMALSNYLFQSLVCTTIFYSYGLGLYGSVGRAAGLGLAVVIYAIQLPLSVWWLRRFRFGPAEWLWRSLTYGKLQPMRT